MMKIRVLALLACLQALPLAAQQVEMSLADARVLATQAVVAGEFDLARALSDQLLAADPDDRDALLVRAAIETQAGDPDLGWAAGARAWRLSDTPDERYEAARVTALAAANGDRFTLSTLWLRIALTAAPDDTARAQTIADARSVTRRNPWSTALTFSLVPTSNLNGGAVDDELRINGESDGGALSEDAQALEGWRASLAVQTQYRFAETAQSAHRVGLQYSANRVRITEAVDVPDASLATDYAELSYRHDRTLAGGTATGRLAFGRLEYATYNSFFDQLNNASYDIARIGLDYQYPLSDQTTLASTVQRERFIYSDPGIENVYRNLLRATVRHALPNADLITASLSVTDSKSEPVNQTSQAWALNASYGWADPIGPVSLSVTGGLNYTDFPDYLLGGAVDGGREDRGVSLGLNFGFAEIAYAGFSPGVSITASRTVSNISRFDRDTVSMGLTLQSSF